MVSAAEGRPLIEMGSRRTHEQAAVAAARAAYIAGFDGSSNLEAQRRYGVPALGTSAHAFTMLHTGRDGPDEPAAFRAQVDALGVGTTLLVDTYDITTGVANAVAVAGTELGAVRIDSGDLGVLARQVRAQLDGLGATGTQIVVSGDLDEFSIAALRADPVDIYGVGTSLVTGSGAPTASMVYKLVEVDGIPVQKRSSHKESHGGRKAGAAVGQGRRAPSSRRSSIPSACRRTTDRAGRAPLTVALVRAGEPVGDRRPGRCPGAGCATGCTSLPWEGLNCRSGEPAIPTRMVPVRRAHESHVSPRSPICWPRAVAALGGSERTRPDRDGRGGGARVRHRRAPGGAGRHRHRQVAGLPGARDRARRRRRDEPGGGVDGDHRPAAPARRPRPAPAGRRAGRRAAPRDRSFALLKGRGNYLCLNKIHNGSATEDPTTGRRTSCSSRSPPPRWAATCSG